MQLGHKLPIRFAEMNATALDLPDACMDLVLADNVFEHFIEHKGVLREAQRVLRPGGKLLVPIFSSIYCKYGLHLKHGLKLPWANLVFSEKTICEAMQRLANDDPRLFDYYPGLRNNPQRVRDVRRYHDLNDITYKQFKADAHKRDSTSTGFIPFRPASASCSRVSPTWEVPS